MMKLLDIGLTRLAILPPTIITMMIFQMMKVLKFLQVMEDVEIGLLIPETLPLAIAEFIIVVAMLDIDIGLKRTATLPLAIAEFIILVMIVEVDLGLNSPATLPLTLL